MLVLVLWSDPTSVLASIGKDVTLTGRTALWDLVISNVHQSPVLGWGYRATWQGDDPITIVASRLVGNFGVTSSHNGFLEITLQLGVIGLGLIVSIIGVALWRGYWCCRAGSLPLGWFSVVFFGGAVLAAQTIETLGRNQSIVWLVFSMLSFSCGLDLAQQKQTRLPNKHGFEVEGDRASRL
jgi:O-antigen ligase